MPVDHRSSKDVGVFMAGGWSLLGYSTNVGIGIEAGSEQGDVLGDTWVYHIPTGVMNASITQSGFWTTEETGAYEMFADQFSGGVAVPGHLSLGGTTLGAFCWMFYAPITAGQNITAERGGIAKADTTFAGAGEVRVGNLVGYSAGIGNSTYTGAATDIGGAGSANGAVGILQIPTMTPDGATGLVVKIQSSTAATGQPWNDRITFPTATAANAFALVDLTTGTVDRYIRILATWSGTPGANATAWVAVSMYRRPAP